MFPSPQAMGYRFQGSGHTVRSWKEEQNQSDPDTAKYLGTVAPRSQRHPVLLRQHHPWPTNLRKTVHYSSGCSTLRF